MPDGPISDGNGGTLDPNSATTRDLLVALHTKMDAIVIPALRDYEVRLRSLERFRYAVPSAVILTLASTFYYFISSSP